MDSFQYLWGVVERAYLWKTNWTYTYLSTRKYSVKRTVMCSDECYHTGWTSTLAIDCYNWAVVTSCWWESWCQERAGLSIRGRVVGHSIGSRLWKELGQGGERRRAREVVPSDVTITKSNVWWRPRECHISFCSFCWEVFWAACRHCRNTNYNNSCLHILQYETIACYIKHSDKPVSGIVMFTLRPEEVPWAVSVKISQV